MKRAFQTFAVVLLAGAAGGCSQKLDAGSNRPHGRLPVDERNPIVLLNDGAGDNWQGEYAVLLANGGGPALAGIVVNRSKPWPDLGANVAGWRELVSAARASGLRNIPDPIASVGPPLVRPASGEIDATAPNRSEGALFIVDASKRLSLPYRPLVVVTGGALTDVADAYLINPTVAERVFVVSSLGLVSASGAQMGNPNGHEESVGRHDRHVAPPVHPGERVLRSARRRAGLERLSLACQSPGRTHRGQAAQPLGMAARVRSSRGVGRRDSELRDRGPASDRRPARRCWSDGGA